MSWDPNKTINELPETIKKIFISEAKFMRQELEEMRLEVTLIPAPDPKFPGHMIRSVNSSNPDWYRELYHNYPKKLDRQCSLKSLDRIIEEKDLPHKKNITYDSLYREIILERLTEGYFFGNEPIPPNPIVCKFFNIRLNPNMFPEGHPYLKNDYRENQVPF